MEELRCSRTNIDNGTTSGSPNLPPCPADTVTWGSSSRRNGNRSCGSCSAACIYNVIDTCFIIGVLANVFVILRVIRDRKLRNPTFIAIAALALADLLFLSLNIARSIETIARTLACTYPPVLRGGASAIIRHICWFSANGHVALMAILRYLMLVYPLRSNYFLTNRKVLIFSGCVWIIGCLFIGFLSMMMRLDVIDRRRSEDFLIYVWSVVYLLPLTVTATLHIVKMRVLRRVTKHDAVNSETRLSVQRMSRIIAIVIFFAAVLPFPRLLYKILTISGNFEFPSPEFRRHFRELSQIVFLSNSFINPFIYAFLSNTFRKSIRRMFWCDDGEQGGSSDQLARGDNTRRRSTEQENISMELINCKA